MHLTEHGKQKMLNGYLSISVSGIPAATSAAAVGGVTTLFDMPLNSNPPTTSLQTLKRKQSLVKVGRNQAQACMQTLHAH